MNILKNGLYSCALSAVFVSTGCGTAEEPIESGSSDEFRAVVLVGDSTCVPLIAGKKADAGTVCVGIDNDVDTSAQCGEGATGVLSLTYETTGPWELVNARMGLGRGLEDLPRTRRGRVKKNELSHQSGDITGALEHTFTVPLCELGLDGADDVCDPFNAHFVAHARVRKQRNNGSYRTKGAWAKGTKLGRRRRAGRFFTMEMTCTESEPPIAECEAAYAAGPGATCFLGADFDNDGEDDGFADWGWSNGPVSPGTSTQWPVYAAVGGCDPSQGEQVGTLGVDYDGTTAVLSFDRTGDVTLDEEQIYVGSDALARDADGAMTVSPSDFPIAVDLDAATQSSHTVTGLSGDIHVVYHALACGTGVEANADPLAVLTDEFVDDGEPVGWTQHRPQDADVSVEGGALILEPHGNTSWYATDQAVQVYKTVSGNFAATTAVQVTNFSGGPVAPGEPYRIGGIMLRDPTSELPNTYHLGIGNMNEPGVTFVSKSTDEGSSTVGTQPWAGTEAELRICRVGADVQSFIRLEGEPWSQVDWHLRADLPDTLAVGPVGYAFSEAPDLRVENDYVQFETVHTLQDCWRD